MFDIAGASICLVIATPFFVVISLLILAKMGRPVFFRHIRTGLNAKPFVLWKFRTMVEIRDENGNLLPDEQRLTKIGSWLRRLSLDELPELFNVLKGEMSLVGPRPLLTQYVKRYSPEQARRMEVKPGITGWAQIHGRNSISWEEKFRLDVWYVDHQNFELDLKILGQTLRKVLTKEGISAEGHATMPEFQGSEYSQQAGRNN